MENDKEAKEEEERFIQFLRGRDYDYIDQLKDPIEKAINFILYSQGEDGLREDPAYIGTVFPQIQYVCYPIFQEVSTLGVLGLYRQDIEFFKRHENPNAQSTSTRPVR